MIRRCYVRPCSTIQVGARWKVTGGITFRWQITFSIDSDTFASQTWCLSIKASFVTLPMFFLSSATWCIYINPSQHKILLSFITVRAMVLGDNAVTSEEFLYECKQRSLRIKWKTPVFFYIVRCITKNASRNFICSKLTACGYFALCIGWMADQWWRVCFLTLCANTFCHSLSPDLLLLFLVEDFACLSNHWIRPYTYVIELPEWDKEVSVL